MKEILSTVTSKGQVTLPVEVRRVLGVRKGDKIAFILDKDKVSVHRQDSVVAATAGIFDRWVEKAANAEDLRAEAEQAIAADTVERTR